MDITKKKVKALISGILTDDTSRVDSIVRELSESMLPNIDQYIIRALTENLRGETDV